MRLKRQVYPHQGKKSCGYPADGDAGQMIPSIGRPVLVRFEVLSQASQKDSLYLLCVWTSFIFRAGCMLAKATYIARVGTGKMDAPTKPLWRSKTLI